METKFTQGKWEIADYLDRETGQRSLAVWVGEQKTICLVSPKGTETEEDFQNAKLIAAAPDMLRTLEEIMEFSPDALPDHVIEIVESAIKNATK